MNATATEGRPVVLVVEDNEEQLDWRTNQLSGVQCMPIGVSSADDAIRELRAGPAIDLVLTDIHLAHHDDDDKSGVALARYVKRTYVDLPVVGYSAYFNDAELGEDKDVFDLVWPKGRHDYKKFDSIMAKCRERALEHRRTRHATAFELHATLRRRHESEHPAVELMRELHPPEESAPVEAVLRKAGYRLKLVEAGGEELAQPIIVWLLDIDGQVEAEVYGQPALYAHGATDEEAILVLTDLMRLYAAELALSPTAEAVGPALSLTEFLRRVLDKSDD